MIPVVISASAIKDNENACLAYVNDLIRTMSCRPRGVLLDSGSLRDTADNNTTDISAFRANLSEWIDASQQPRRSFIRSQAGKLPADIIVLLDARHHEANVISAVLHEITLAWFPLTPWQPAFALIVDDFESQRFVNELFATFYIQPLSTMKQNIQTDVRALRRKILTLRWLGLGRGAKIIRLFYRYLQRWKAYVKSRVN